nr:hypothetical protein [Tanacetum cinerariifolium]
ETDFLFVKLVCYSILFVCLSNAPALHVIRAGKVQKGNKHNNTMQGLRASRKPKPRALSLYVGNGQREAVEAI